MASSTHPAQERVKPARGGAIPRNTPPALLNLSVRQLQVLHLVLMGCTNRRIAQELGLAFYTASTHVKNLYKKLGVHKRTELFSKVLGRQIPLPPELDTRCQEAAPEAETTNQQA